MAKMSIIEDFSGLGGWLQEEERGAALFWWLIETSAL
jgi:hypothetical protein